MKKLQKTLKQMYESGDEDNFLIIADGSYYIHIFAGKKAPNAFIDAVANAHLEESEFLSDDQNKQLLDLGYEIDSRSKNYSMIMPFGVANIDNIIEKVVKTSEIYKIDLNSAEFELEID